MELIKRLCGKDLSGLPAGEVFAFCAGLCIDNLIDQYNLQPGVEPVPAGEINEFRRFMHSFGCPPALLYDIAGIPRNMPLTAYNFSFADLDCEFTRDKGEVVRTVFRAKDGRPAVQKDRVYVYAPDLVPESKTNTIVWFYSDGEEALRVSKTIPLNDKGRAKSLRFNRLSQNLIDVNDWLRSAEGGGLSDADFAGLAGQMSPYLEAYRNGIITPLLSAVSGSDLVFLAGVKEELIDRLYVSA